MMVFMTAGTQTVMEKLVCGLEARVSATQPVQEQDIEQQNQHVQTTMTMILTIQLIVKTLTAHQIHHALLHTQTALQHAARNALNHHKSATLVESLQITL